MFNLHNHREMGIKMTLRYHFTTVCRTVSYKSDKKNPREYLWMKEPVLIVGDSENKYKHCGNEFEQFSNN